MTTIPETAHATSHELHRIAVVIVNYGTAALTIKGVQSVLARKHGGRDVDVYVVDNASPDDSADVLRAAHADQSWGARVQLFLETENHGFGRGNNVVLRQLAAQDNPPDAAFLLNPDAYLDNEAIDLLAKALEDNPGTGFSGAGIAKPGGEAVTAAFRFPSIFSEFSEALNFGPISRLFKSKAVPLPPDHPAGLVDWVAGAAVMMRMDALREIDYFDPRFFLYYEEVDLMYRGKAAGWNCLYVPDAKVFHIEGEATGVKSGRAVAKRVPGYRYDAWQYYFLKTHGRVKTLLTAVGMIIGTLGNRLISALRGRASNVPAYYFTDFWQHSLRPLLGFGKSG